MDLRLKGRIASKCLCILVSGSFIKGDAREVRRNLIAVCASTVKDMLG